jgi:hypothetical protein
MKSNRQAGAATLEDVAQAARVSLATASRTLNETTRNVNPEYRERVLAAARELSYSPNLAARAVAQGGGTSTVALIVPDIADPYFSTIASGVARAAEERGLIVELAITDRHPEREAELVWALRGRRPRSVVVVGSRWMGERSRSELLAELIAYENAGGRVTMVSQPDLPFRTVEIGNRRCGRAGRPADRAGLPVRRHPHRSARSPDCPGKDIGVSPSASLLTDTRFSADACCQGTSLGMASRRRRAPATRLGPGGSRLRGQRLDGRGRYDIPAQRRCAAT